MEHFLYRLIHPWEMFFGMLIFNLMWLSYIYVCREERSIHHFIKQYPGVGILIMLIIGCFLFYNLRTILIFLLGVLISISGKYIC
jgi:hypothetical protein